MRRRPMTLTRVSCRLRLQGRTSGEEELTNRRVDINRPTNHVPDIGEVLPLIDQ